MADKTIEFSSEPDFLVKSGLMFIGELKEDSSKPSAPQGIRQDWDTLANWVGYQSGELSAIERRRLEKAWIAYLSIGLAPSAQLQSAFANFASQFPAQDKADCAPTEVMNVFDRLLATDNQIKAKRAADWKEEEARFHLLFEGLKSRKKSGWWRKQSSLTRTWVFASIVWATCILVYALFFDPFDVGGWNDMSGDETARLALIVFTPVGAGMAYYAYSKWVR